MQTAVQPPLVAVILCAVLELEVEHFARGLPHIVHVEKLEQGLHNDPPRLRERLQQAIERVEATTAAEVIALGYGLCSRGTEGVKTRRCRLVIARAHDCITLLLGSKERYAAYVARRPGTYWYSPGWNKHHLPPGKERYQLCRQRYAEKHGEQNADFLMQTEQAWFNNYSNAVYVHLGVGDLAADIARTRACAEWLGWSCEVLRGDPALLQALLSGPWDEQRFLVLQPGETFKLVADERIIIKDIRHDNRPSA